MTAILHPEQERYLKGFSGSTDLLTIRMEEFAAKNKIPILNPLACNFLEQLVYLNNPKRFLEIGTAIGYSTIRVAKIIRKDAIIDSIELSKDNIKLANNFIDEAKLEVGINILEGNALDIMRDLKNRYDFIFLDADKEDYLDLFGLSLNLLNKNGILLVDNLLWQGFTAAVDVPDKYKKSTEFIRKFNAQFLSNPYLNSTLLPIGDGLGLGIKIK